MLNKIRDCIHSLSIILNDIENPTISTRLTNIETKLIKIERELRRQRYFAVYVFLYALSLSTISIGLAIRVDYPHNGLILMVGGLALMGLTAIVGIIIWLVRKI